MSAAPKQVRLCLNLQATGRHDAAWKTLPPTADWLSGIDYYIEIARLAEQARFDAIFIADRLGVLDEPSHRRPWRGADPVVLLAALARETDHIGLVATNPALQGDPFTRARAIATLDHVSRGRAAWNIVNSQEEVTRRALGLGEQPDDDTRYRRAEEFVSAVDALWASLPEDAVVADAAADTYIDAARTRPVRLDGEFHRSEGVLPLPGGYRGQRPVLFHAGASRRSMEFGARWADALFTSQRVPELARTFTAEVKGLAAANGRRPEDLLVLPGLFVILGATEAEARQRRRELDQQLAVEPLLAALEAVLPTGFVEFTAGVVAELQDRGRFRREYAHETFRENLGLSPHPLAAGPTAGPSGGSAGADEQTTTGRRR